jgi:broad specificity phosphatase PhoE
VRLLLIRHGQTPSNVAGLLDTAHPGPGLTQLGTRQAAQIPVALSNDVIGRIYVSTLLRTHLTAAPLAADRGLDAIELPGIHEIEAGSLEGHSDRASVHQYLETVFSWGLGNLDSVMPGSTDGHAFFNRFDADIARVAADHDADQVIRPDIARTAVMVSHGAAIRVWVAGRAINIAPSFAGEHEIDNTGMAELEGNPHNGWVLLSWQGTPVGGTDLVDASAEDPTGDRLSDS